MKNLAILLALALIGGAILTGCSGGTEEDPATKGLDPAGKKGNPDQASQDDPGAKKPLAPL